MNSTDAAAPWPEPTDLVHVTQGGQRYGRTPEGLFPGVTGVLKKTLGLSSEALLGWTARVEREACLQVAESAIDSLRHHPTGVELREMMESGLGKARAANMQMERAAEIGTQLHEMIAWFLRRELEQDAGTPPSLSGPAMAAYIQWTGWWQKAGIRPLRVEQPLWDTGLGYSGTADLIGERNGLIGVWDFKSSAGIYLEHHVQVAAYVHAAKRWAPVSFGEVVRLPKKAGDTFDQARDVEPCGEHRYSGRTLTVDELVDAWRATLSVWGLLVKPRPAPVVTVAMEVDL